ncbi:MAG TPA: hypothetical protein VFE07_07285 [Marmoricola sp.]|jgi:hypothetical protein|nr:hypothetical protein [Marmoricola sp.]
MNDQVKVPNPYLAAIKANRASSVEPSHTLATALDKAVTAMESGAWVGGKADAFHSALTGHRTTARNAGPRSLQEFDDAISGQPEMVDANSWQVHWHNLGP